jgi:hypothetical protein
LDNLQIYLNISNFKIRRINYPKQNNPQIFEYYTIEKANKFFTYLLPNDNFKLYLQQFNTVISMLNKLVTYPSCLENVDFQKINNYAEKMKKSTFLNGLFDNYSIYAKRDIIMMVEIEKNPEKLFNIIIQYFPSISFDIT